MLVILSVERLETVLLEGDSLTILVAFAFSADRFAGSTGESAVASS